MHGKIWTFARLAIPIDFRILLYGVAVGLFAGLISLLVESPELATGRGIATAVSCSLGLWLGINLWLLTLRVLRLWSASLTERFEALESSGMLISGDTDMPAGDRNAATIESVLFGLVPVGFGLTIYSAVLAVIDLQVDIYSAVVYVPWLCLGIVYVFLGIAGQCWYLWRDSRRVARLERRLESAEAMAPVTLQTPRLERAISKASSIVCKLTGIGCPAGDETATA